MNKGLSDEKLLHYANTNRLILITEDKDFGDLVFRLNLSQTGIILLRLFDIPRVEKIEVSCTTIIRLQSQVRNSFVVITKNKVRIRKLPNLHK